MKPDPACAPCLLRWLSERIMRFGPISHPYEAITSILEVLYGGFRPEANVGSLANRTIEKVSEYLHESAEHYRKIKMRNNQIAMESLVEAEAYIANGKTLAQSFERACTLAAASNIAPIGAPPDSFLFREVEDVIRGKSPMPVLSEGIYEAVQKAHQVLYVADNAGELAFDALLISGLREMGAKVSLVVKNGPFFEDATREDAAFFSVDHLAHEVFGIRGFFVPSELPRPLLDCLERTDLIISKGTGNYEALRGEAVGKTRIYMLKVKCNPIAKDLGADMGSVVVHLEG